MKGTNYQSFGPELVALTVILVLLVALAIYFEIGTAPIIDMRR